MKLITLFAIVVAMSSSLVVADHHALEMAINGEHRKENSQRDKYRNPKETLTFLGVEADHKVLEISPGGGGWYMRNLGYHWLKSSQPTSSEIIKSWWINWRLLLSYTVT